MGKGVEAHRPNRLTCPKGYFAFHTDGCIIKILLVCYFTAMQDGRRNSPELNRRSQT